MNSDNNNLDNTIFDAENQDSEENNSFNTILKTAKDQRDGEFFAMKWTLKAILISLLFLGLLYYFTETQKNPQVFSVNNVIKKTGLRSKWMTLTGNKNILVLGVDSNGKMSDPFFGTRSDCIIIVNIDKHGNSVNAVSIPRDSKVYLPHGHGIDKINSAHALGGPELTVETVENTFGIDINNYMVINYDGIKDFVKALDGIPVNVEKRMYYRDRSAGLIIDLQPGKQVLNADEAEGYLRFRHDATGDIGRIRRQQWFLRAVLKKLKSGKTILKAPELMEILSKNIRTDLNLFELSKLLNIALNLKLEDVKVATLPGRPSKYGPVSYWVLNAGKTQKIIDRLIYREPPEKTTDSLSVNLLYSPGLKNKMDSMVENIHKLGFKVKYRLVRENHYSRIISHTNQASFSRVNQLRREIPALKESQYVVEPDAAMYPRADITIILSSEDDF